MSMDEDTDLRDAVAASLKAMGVLGKIKAELRCNVYLALESQEELKSKSQSTNPKLDSFMSTSEGRLAAYLVREFLEFLELDFSLAVFEPEALDGRCRSKSRDDLCESLGFGELLRNDFPILSEIIRLSKVTILKSETPTQMDEDVSNRSEEETSLRSSVADESQKSSVSSHGAARNKLASPSHHSVTPESSFTNNRSPITSQHPSLELLSNPETTFVVNKETKPEGDSLVRGSTLTSRSDLPKLTPQSSLGDLPPLTSSGSIIRNSPVKLAPLKKVPSLEKAPLGNSQDESSSRSIPATTQQDSTSNKAAIKQTSINLPTADGSMKEGGVGSSAGAGKTSDDDEIEEEMDDFLNSDVSATDDFTKDETASEAASLRADYVEKFP